MSQAMATGMPHPSKASSGMPSGFQGRVAKPPSPKLVREAEKPVPLTPSAFQKEMSLTTKERLASTKKLTLPYIAQPKDKSETSDHKVSSVDPYQSSLQLSPPEMVFQNFIPGEACEMPLVLRNRDKVPQLVKVTMENSPYFQLVSPSGACRKVPPGLFLTVRVVFTPQQNKDYFHQLLCSTEREEFIVPLRAIGARAILDFPDQLDFSRCPVKCSTQKTLLIRNIGKRTAHYQISTQIPFSVIPAMGSLDVGDAMNVTVEFQPLLMGHYFASLVVHYDTGEDIYTSLRATAVDLHIRLDRNAVIVKSSYITLSSHTTVLIHNFSDITAHFQWKSFDTHEKEDDAKLKNYVMLCLQEKDNLRDLLKECKADTTPQERLALLSRIFENERAKLRGDPMLFDSEIFSLEPKEGEIRPNCSAEITVTFKPQEAQVYEQPLYCEISGRETRLPLLLTGEGLGPQLSFRFGQLDIGQVFLREAKSYKVILENKGPIEAPFRLVPPTTPIGSCVTFLPQEGIVTPYRFRRIQIFVCPTILGEFKEEFQFSVAGSPTPAIFTIEGLVIGPTFHFDVPALHFGDVSFGFSRTLKCCLFNTSRVPFSFTLRIPEDGSGEPSISSTAQIFSISHQSWTKGAQDEGPMEPREFIINPSTGTISPQRSQDIEVTLCSNTVKEYNMELVMDMDGVGERVSALSLTARCVAPLLRVLNPVLQFGRCCLKLPSEKTVTVVNDSDFPGCYIVPPQEHREKARAWYSSSKPCGIVSAHSSLEIPLSLEAQRLGPCSITAPIVVFGREDRPLEIRLECIGQGPVVYVHPRQLDFGSIPVLEDNPKTLYLSNQTGIPATFWAELAGKCSHWRVEPSKGVVPPFSDVSVIVTANLNDTGKLEDKVKVFIENSNMNIISVQAVGIGTTIVPSKPFGPELSLGHHFSFIPCRYHLKMTNKGRRIHYMYWTTEGFSAFHRHSRPSDVGGKKKKNASQIPRPGSPVFKLQPRQMNLKPGETVEVVLEGCSSTPQDVKERLLCHGYVGKEKERKPIMHVDITCKFISPTVKISTREITFRVEKQPSDVLTLQHEPLTLKNTSALPVSLELNLEQPFLICNVDRQPLPAASKPSCTSLTLDVEEELHLFVQFNPAYKKGLKSRAVEKTLRMGIVEHPYEKQITVRGEVFFPNLCLQAKAVDFGCIINETEQELHMEMTNCSPIPAQYRWYFLVDRELNTIRFNPSPPKFKPQSKKTKGLFQRKYSVAKHVVENSAQEVSARDSLAQDDAVQKGSAQDNSAQQGSYQQPSDGEDSLEAEVPPAVASNPRSMMMLRRLRELRRVQRYALGMREVFDVRPLWGVVAPGQSHCVTFTFYGHANIVARCMALCCVEGGPSYKVVLTGAASYPSYRLDVKEIDFGLQVFNQVLKEEVTLQNTGLLEFTYAVPNASTGTAANPLPGVPVVVPATGSIAPGEKQVLKVFYLPGRLGTFCSTFQVQVSFLDPAEVILKGEGTFPRITMDLPWVVKGNKKCEKIVREIRKSTEGHTEGNEPSSLRKPEQCRDDSDDDEEDEEAEDDKKVEEEEEEEEESEKENEETLQEGQGISRKQKPESRKSSFPWSSVAVRSPTDTSGTIEEPLMQLQIEEKLITKRILELERAVTGAPQDRVFNKQMRQSLVNIELPIYILDMGCIGLNQSTSSVVTITNPGLVPVSFRINERVLENTGFSVQPNRVKGLTYGCSCKLKVHFNTDKLRLGKVDVVLPIKVARGYTVRIRICVTVTDSGDKELQATSSTKWKLSSERSERSDQSLGSSGRPF